MRRERAAAAISVELRKPQWKHARAQAEHRRASALPQRSAVES